PLLVAFSFGEATRNGTTVSISMSVYAPPPAGTPLYVSFTNPYVFLNGYLEYILPYAERIKDGDVDALVEMSNGMSAFMTNLTNLTLSPEGAITQLLSAELAGDCFPDNDVEVTPEPEVTEVPPTPQVNISTVCDDGMLTISVDWTAILGDLSFANIPLTYVLSLNPSYNAANMNDGALHIGSLTNDGSGIFRGSVAFLPIIVRNKDNIYLHYVDYPRLLTAITNSGGNMPNMTDYMSTVKLDLSGCDFANTPVPAVSITAECVSDYNGRISITFDDFEDYFLNEIELFDAGILFEGSVRLADDSQIYTTYANATYPHGETVLTYATDETARGGVVVFRHVDVLAVLSLLENGQPGNYVYADYVVPNCLPDAPTALTVPVAPTFSVDSLTCADAGGLSVQITQGDVTTYGQQFDALLRQLVPEGTLPFTFFDVYNTLGGSNGVPIILSHTAPVNMAQIDTSIVWVGGSADGVTLSNGTQTFTVALSSALSVPSNTSFYITVLSAEKAG
ncbi:MAG: hypothetical protein KJ043_19590, partial [Anaerolineae bacterium]|nr:hypothetical protein [Anaerolineae bacterium]